MTPTLTPSNAPKKARIAFAKFDAAWLAMPLGLYEFKVLTALSLHADWRKTGVGRCYPKRETIALECGIQVSHVSEAVRSLANRRLITVVRLGRKNIYYVRPIGAAYEMPPSDAAPFFRYLKNLGLSFQMNGDEIFYASDTRHKFEDFPTLIRSIFNDYATRLIKSKLQAAIASQGG